MKRSGNTNLGFVFLHEDVRRRTFFNATLRGLEFAVLHPVRTRECLQADILLLNQEGDNE